MSRRIVRATTFAVPLLLLATSASEAAAQGRRGESSRRARAVEVDPPEENARVAPAHDDDAPAAPPRRRRDAVRGEEEPEDEGPSRDGFSFGARVGYAIPMGSIAKDASLGGANDLSKTAAGMAPLWIDAGYRITPNWYVGGYFQLGIVSTSGDLCRRMAGNAACSSSGTNIRFGAMGRYTFKPDGKVSPWLGVSTGYEILDVGVTVGSNSADLSAKGWELVGFHVGADFHPSRSFSLGPMFSASFGQYASQSWSRPDGSGSADFTKTSLHQWAMFGLRGQFDM